MLFNSLSFLIFLPTVLILYNYIPGKYKWVLLLVASLYFYMWWKWEYIFIMFIPATIDFFVAHYIQKYRELYKKRVFLAISVISNLGLLFYFKYYTFFFKSIEAIALFSGFDFTASTTDILLPIGISFYTFQSMSYIFEVYHGRQSAEKNFGKFALFVSYFPQLVAGPINRPQILLPQLKNLQPLVPSNIVQGLRLILWGLFKKVVIADRLAYFVKIVYDSPDSYHGLSILIATVFFAFQIYCDFSGYSDIAIGTAKTMGVNLMQNFRTPYFSTSIREFWSRWHISLSTWFKDYVYIPLGGNRVSVNRWLINLFITFLVSGIWHGASWKFGIWGAIHGFIIAFESYSSMKGFSVFSFSPVVGRIWTFSIVCFAWIFFRANSVDDAFLVVSNLFDTSHSFAEEVKTLNGSNIYNLFIGIPLIVLLLTLETVKENSIVQHYFHANKLFRYACYISLIIMMSLFGVFISQSSFIYFQF